MYELIVPLLLASAVVGAGLMAGVYFAFSFFIMRAFDRLGVGQATDAMNSINDVILRSAFMPVFFGSTLLYAILGLLAIVDADVPNRWLLLFICVNYIVGMFLCTAIFNVPLNNRLANSGKSDREDFEFWTHYVKDWTRWNHLRCFCSLLSLALGILYLFSYNQEAVL